MNLNASWNRYENRSLSLEAQGWNLNFFARFRQKLPWGPRHDRLLPRMETGSVALYEEYHLLCRQHILRHRPPKSFLKEKRLSVRVGISNPFSNSTRTQVTSPVNAWLFGIYEILELPQSQQYQHRRKLSFRLDEHPGEEDGQIHQQRRR